MNAGRLEQIGSADDIYSRPETAFAASFVGEANQFHGRVTAATDGHAIIETAHGPMRARNPQRLDNGASAILFVRPEAMSFDASENRIAVQLERRDMEGAFINLMLRSDHGAEVAVCLPNQGGGTHVIPATALVGFSPDAGVILPAGAVAKTGREELAAE